MTCQHDQTYRIDNEANGGQGCPRCNRRVVLVQHADGAREVDPAFGLTVDDMKRIAEDAMQNQPPIEY